MSKPRFNIWRRRNQMPVVDAEDAIQRETPPDVTGMTKEQADAAMNQFRETVLANARRMVTEAQGRTPPVTPPPTPPAGDNISRAEFNALTEAAKQGMIFTAQLAAKEGKSDWDRYFGKVKAIVESLPLDQQINKDVWQEAYYNVRGRDVETRMDESRKSALGLEPPSAPPPPPPTPRVFTDEEKYVAERMGISTEEYAKAADKLASGFQPFTVDNRRGARA
jgi:hypothetical protein